MKTRFQIRREKKGKNFDPLVIEEFDWDNEWADSSHVHPQGARGCDENDLTWAAVDEALGASNSLWGHNLPRNASSRCATNSNPRLDEDESGLGNEEEEDEDPHDDAYVTDSEDAPPDGGESMEGLQAANNHDEFDDGYWVGVVFWAGVGFWEMLLMLYFYGLMYLSYATYAANYPTSI